jgi:HAD superfamily hydrolase (TIGR01490 family)
VTAAPEPAPGKRAAAFFDLDKTLMQGSSAFQFARAVREAGLRSRRQLLADAAMNLSFRVRGATDERSEALRNLIAHQMQGIRVREMERLGVRVLARILPKLYPEMLTIAYEHQDAGRPVFIVTAAAQGLADVLANVLLFDGAVGSGLSEIEDGVYTGRPTGAFLYREAKAVAIRAMAEEHGFDLDASYAYSDSTSDLPMLSIVGHPVVVNPDAELRRLAREHGWEIRRLDPIRRHLATGAGLLFAAAAGVAAAAIVTSRRAKGRDSPTRPAPYNRARGLVNRQEDPRRRRKAWPRRT